MGQIFLMEFERYARGVAGADAWRVDLAMGCPQ